MDPSFPSLAPPHYRAFGYTHVIYTEGDRVGLVLALLSLTPVFAMVAYTTLMLSRRDFATISLCVGQLGNEVVNYVLKRLIRQPRPVSHLDTGTQPKWGMPSDHSQFMGFAVGYLTLWILRRWVIARQWRLAWLTALYLLAGLVMYSRAYLGYHSLLQVAAGGCLGVAVGAAWYGVTELLLRPLFPRLARLEVCRWLCLRDCGDVPNVLLAEYEACAPSGRGAKAH